MLKPLPACWWITPDILSVNECSDLLKLFDERITQGIRHIQFRQTQLNPNEFQVVFQQVSAYCKNNDVTLIINSEPELALKLRAEGCYLNSDILMKYNKRPLSKDYLVGAYCHNLAELLHAQKIDLDFVSLSPVQKTLSHPEQTPMGWEKFEALVKQTSLPVYALGGMRLEDKNEAISRGGQGIMGIRF